MATLYAFYDLATAPPTFDYFVFMELAEQAKRRGNYQTLCMVFVPGPNGGFRADNLPPDNATRWQMFRNLVVPATMLIPSLGSMRWLETREEAWPLFERAEGHVFPVGYSPNVPFSEYMWIQIAASMIRGEKIRNLTAPAEWLDRAGRYLDMVTGGRKAVTVTLREAAYHPIRNSDLGAWKAFIDWLDKDKYFPIVIRDTNNAYRSLGWNIPTEICHQASTDILFRTALYQRSFVNLMNGNGCGDAALLTNAPLIVCKFLIHDYIATDISYFNNFQGVPTHRPYATWARNQIVLWEENDFESIRGAFMSHSLFLERGDRLHDNHGFEFPEQFDIPARALLATYRAKGYDRLHRHEIDTALAIATQAPSNVEAVLLGGSLAALNGNFDRALTLFVASLQYNPGNPHLVNNSVVVLELLSGLGRQEEALTGYRLLHSHQPQEKTAARIAELEQLVRAKS